MDTLVRTCHLLAQPVATGTLRGLRTGAPFCAVAAAADGPPPTVDAPLGLAAPTVLLLLLLVVIIIIVVAQLLFNPLERWRMRHVPGFAWRPVLGNLPMLAQVGAFAFFAEGHARFICRGGASSSAERGDDAAEAADKAAAAAQVGGSPPSKTPATSPSSSTPEDPTYRPAVWRAWFGPRAWIVIADAELARRVAGRLVARPPLSAVGPTKQDRAFPGLFMARGGDFHALKRAWQPAFAPASLERYAPLMERAAGELVARLRAEAAESAAAGAAAGAHPEQPCPINMYQALGDMSMEIVGTCAFGVDFATIATGSSSNSSVVVTPPPVAPAPLPVAPAHAAVPSAMSPCCKQAEHNKKQKNEEHDERPSDDDDDCGSSVPERPLTPPPSCAGGGDGARDAPSAETPATPIPAPLPRTSANDDWRSEGRELVQAACAMFGASAGIRTSPWSLVAAALPWLAPVVRVLAERWPDGRMAEMRRSRGAMSRAALRLIAQTRAKRQQEQEQQQDAATATTTATATATRATGIAPGSFLAQLMAFSDAQRQAQLRRATEKAAAATSSPSLLPPSPPSLPPLRLGGSRARSPSPAPSAIPPPLPDASLVSQANTFMLGGSETTANLLAMATRLLAEHPDKATKLRAEIDAADAAGADAAASPYASAVLDEALRLYPPGALLLRDPSAMPDDAPPLVLPLRTDGCGGEAPGTEHLVLPRTARVFVDLYAIHRDPRYWPRAGEFLPERFLAKEHGGDPTLGPRTPSAYGGFGWGSRSCPGAKFAMREARLVLVALHRAFEFELPPLTGEEEEQAGKPPKMVLGITLSPVGGVWLRVRERSRSGSVAAPGLQQQPLAAAPPSSSPAQPSTPTKQAAAA
jgi:cytochrome P450